MTSQRTLNRLFTLHSWAGIVTGLLMFIEPWPMHIQRK